MTSLHVFHRPAYAQALAERMLKPGPLDAHVRSGIFLHGMRRIGKTTFLKQDLIPELVSRGALVIYVDLWVDRSRSPLSLLLDAVKVTFKALTTAESPLLNQLRRLSKLDVKVAGLAFGFEVGAIGTSAGVSLASAFVELVDTIATDVVVVIDEVQQASLTEDGLTMLHALKAARDAVNVRQHTVAHLIILGIGSHKSLVADMATRRSQPFAGALSLPYQPLDADFVDWKIRALARLSELKLPSERHALEGFETLGHRPEDFEKALAELQLHPYSSAKLQNFAFLVICSTLAAAATATELATLDDIGELAHAVFKRVAMDETSTGVSGLFSDAAIKMYQDAVDIQVTTAQVQNIIDKLIAANLVMRVAHGRYKIVDPYIARTYRQAQAIRSAGDG